MGEDNLEEVTSPKIDSTSYELDAPILRSKKSLKLLMLISAGVAVVALVFGAFYFGSRLNQPGDAQKLQGTVALSEHGLRDLVNRQHLTVYWTGAVSGNKYTLFIPKAGAAVVRYLPPGTIITDTSSTFRLVATFIQKNAFVLTSAAILQKTNLGFVNIDGNAAYYLKTRPTNVFVGLKGKDIQIEIFDPGQGQAVALALFKGQIIQIK